MNGPPIHVDSATLEAVEAEADRSRSSMGMWPSGALNLTFRGDPIVYDPRLDKLRECVMRSKDGEPILLERPVRPKGDDVIPVEYPGLANKWIRQFTEPEALEASKNDLLPWHRRLYGVLDPVEFWVSVAILAWWAISVASPS